MIIIRLVFSRPLMCACESRVVVHMRNRARSNKVQFVGEGSRVEAMATMKLELLDHVEIVLVVVLTCFCQGTTLALH